MTEREMQEQLARELEARFLEAMMGGPSRKQRQTALRVRGNCFETVEIGDEGTRSTFEGDLRS